MIPAISNFLNVSIDELFEADKKAERLQKIKDELFKKYYDGFIEETVELCRNSLKEFPNDYDIMYYLFTALATWYFKFENNNDEIIELGERIINDCENYEMKMQTISQMAVFYSRFDTDKSKKLAEKLPGLSFGITNSKEKVTSIICAENAKICSREHIILSLVHELCGAITSLADVSPEDEKIAVQEKAMQVLNIIYDNGDYSSYENKIFHGIYRQMAEDYIKSGEHEKALDCLEKSADYSIADDNNHEIYSYTSLLLKYVKMSYRINHGSPTNMSYSFIHDFLLKRDIYAPIRETERFKSVIAKLEKYAKSEKTE